MFHLLFTILQTAFVLQVYAGPQCIIKNNCSGEDMDLDQDPTARNKTDSSFQERIPQWQSVSGDCFVPIQEECQIEWSTLLVWVFLLLSTFVLGAKEAFQLMHSQKVIQTDPDI